MLNRLKELLQQSKKDPDAALDTGQALRVATAALLVEMARADFSESVQEREEILRVLTEHFSLDVEAGKTLLLQANEQADQSVSLHEFTRLLHEQLEPAEKEAIVAMLWRVALADARLDKYEDYLVRKIADLLYVSNSDVVRLKHRVLGELDSGE